MKKFLLLSHTIGKIETLTVILNFVPQAIHDFFVVCNKFILDAFS